jgi:N-acetylmuramoyl-L-alanine amidase
VARWNGLELRLGFAPQQINYQPCVHSLDLDKTIQPLLGRPLVLASRTVVLDPGHGGTDSGTRSVLGGAHEKDYTLDWALRVRKLLLDQGWNVLLTRTTDVDVALSNRVAFATERHAALFVSLHFNSAAPNQSESGLETYCLTPAGMASSLLRDASEDISQSFPNNAFDAENIAFGVRVHRSLLQVNGQQDRGVRRARFLTVLRGQQCPAVLVEGGYLSNPQEARQIADPAHRQKLAEAIARALPSHELRVQQ